MLRLLIYLAIIVVGLWALWRFFIRNPLNRLLDDSENDTHTGRTGKDEGLFDGVGKYVPYREDDDRRR